MNTCVICGEVFNGRTKLTAMCSAKCRQRKYRMSDKGIKQVKTYNKRYKRQDIEKTCESCGKLYTTARKLQRVCNDPVCIKNGVYLTQKRYRSKNLTKARARDIISKRLKRGISLQRKSCTTSPRL